MTKREYIALAEDCGKPIPEDLRQEMEADISEVIQLSDGGYIGIRKPLLIRALIPDGKEFLDSYGDYLLKRLIQYEKRIKTDRILFAFAFCEETAHEGIYINHMFDFGLYTCLVDGGIKTKILSDEDKEKIIRCEMLTAKKIEKEVTDFFLAHGLNTERIKRRNPTLSRYQQLNTINKCRETENALEKLKETTKQKLDILTRGLTK